MLVIYLLIINGMMELEIAQYDSPRAIHLLIVLGADVNAYDNNRTPLISAIENQHKEAAKELIRSGADVNLENTDNASTPLMAAAYYGHVSIVKLLLSKGADMNARDKAGHSVFWWAKEGEKDEYGSDVVAILKQVGAKR